MDEELSHQDVHEHFYNTTADRITQLETFSNASGDDELERESADSTSRKSHKSKSLKKNGYVNSRDSNDKVQVGRNKRENEFTLLGASSMMSRASRGIETTLSTFPEIDNQYREKKNAQISSSAEEISMCRHNNNGNLSSGETVGADNLINVEAQCLYMYKDENDYSRREETSSNTKNRINDSLNTIINSYNKESSTDDNYTDNESESSRVDQTLVRSRTHIKRRKYHKYSAYNQQMESDKNTSAESSGVADDRRYNPASQQSKTQVSKCSDPSNIFQSTILFLKSYLSSSSQLQAGREWRTDEMKEELKFNDKLSKLERKESSDKKDHMYQSINNSGGRRNSRKSSIRGDKIFESNHHLRKYCKLDHPYIKVNQQDSLLHELRRLFLLLLILCVTCLLVWLLYSVFTDEFNYLGVVETPSILGRYNHYAVSTDAKPCAKVGSNLLAKGGSAVDAAIGTLICMGVIIPNSLGLGGGCLMTIYDAKKKEAVVIDGREIAPDYATENMFANDSLKASRGPLSTGIPGELAAYWKAHQMYGKLNWSQLFDESIGFAEEGAPVVEHLAYAFTAKNHAKHITPPMAKLYTNNKTGKYYEEGDILVQKELANTLRRIRDHGVTEFYGGQTGQLFVNDLKAQGGKITLENLVKYEALVKKPLIFKLTNDTTLYTQPLPGSGIVLSIIMRIMNELGYYKNHKPQRTFEGASLYYHRLVEAFKFAYAQRAGLEDLPDDPSRMETLMNKLRSDEFIRETISKLNNKTHDATYYGNNDYFSQDHGTAHVSVLDDEGNAAAVTSSVNLYFGSGLISPSTGITYNDVMDDFVSPNIVNKFKLPPTKYNHIKPGRRPLSSMAPSVFTDENGNVKLIIGGSGGSKITTAIASVSLRHCFLGEDIKTATDGARVHHQLLPNHVSYELNFPKDLLHSLSNYGHSIDPILDRSSVIMSIANSQNNGTKLITANSDHRKGGSVDGF